MSILSVEISNPEPTPVVEVNNPAPIPVVEVATPGPTGPTGLSAYELAVIAGFVGNLDAWLASLHGPGFIVLPEGETEPPPGTPPNTIVFQIRT